MSGKRQSSQKSRDRVLKEVLPQLDALYHESTDLLTQPEGSSSESGNQEYRYFDYRKIGEELDIQADVDSEAKQLIAEHEYKHFAVNMVYRRNGYDELPDPETAQEMVGRATMIQEYGHWTELIFGPDVLLQASCNDWSCYASRRKLKTSPVGHRLCKHEAATLYLLQEYLEKENPGDATNYVGTQLLKESFVEDSDKAKLTSADLSVAMQHLEPYVFVGENGRLDAYFRIGAGRLYKVKNIPDLVEHVRAGKDMNFGSTTTLRMGQEYLDETGRKWLDMMSRAVEEEKRRAEALNQAGGRGERNYYGEHGYEFEIKDKLPLYGSWLDQFFVLAQGSYVEFQFKEPVTGKRRKVQMLMRTGKLDLKLQLKAMVDFQGVYQGVQLSGQMPMLLEGVSYTYLLKEPSLLRLEGERNDNLSLLEKMSVEGKVDIRIGRNELRNFYHNYLPAIRRVAEIEEKPEDHDLTQRHLPPEAVLICFLDADDGNVICQPSAIYGDRVYSVTDLRPGVNAPIDALRDMQAEMSLLTVLSEYFSSCDARLKILFTPREDEAVFRFLDEGLGRLLEICEVRSTERFRRLGVRRKVRINMGVSVSSSLMDLDVTSTELSRDELLEVLNGYRQKRRFIRLKNGDFLKLDNNDQVARLTELMDSLRVSPREFVQGKMHIPAYRALYLDRMLEESESLYADRDRSFKSLIKQFKTISDADFELPESLHDVLRKYQKAGYRWLRTLDANHFGGILADEMGLGKTLQVICTLLAVRQETEEALRRPSLVVCPASLVYNWGEELRRFAPQLRTKLVVGSVSERREILADALQADVLVTSYDLLKRDIDGYEEIRFRFEVIDEAQFIKNHATAAAKTVKLIHADTRYALTGTPIENRLSELWSIFDYLMPGFLYEYASFRRDIETPIVKYGDEDVRKRLSRMVSPFILRRLKLDVLKDLPEKLEEIRYAGMETEQRRLYDAQVVKMKQTLHAASDSDFQKQKIQILAELTKLRQICCDPSLCFENYQGASAKREAVIDLITGAIEGGHRILVFSQFVQMLTLLEADLHAAGIDYFIISGATPKQKRMELVNAFNEGQVPVFLISLKAGGTGLNLTGADTVVHYDPWWNLAVQNQATDRAHRIGQKQVVTVYKMIMKGTIEEKIVEMQETKKQLAEDILSGEGISSASITREDLLGMLE